MTTFGVSWDSVEKNRAFAAQHKLPFLLLSDLDRKLSKTIGAAPFLIPFPKRISYLVGGDGRVLRAYQKVDPATHATQVLDDLRALDQG